MNDGAALLDAIRENSDEDTPRLIYADHLDGLDTVSVRCTNGLCGGDAKPGYVRVNSGRNYRYGEPREKPCGRCNGTALVPDTSARDRAELIRVQIELANGIAVGTGEPVKRELGSWAWHNAMHEIGRGSGSHCRGCELREREGTLLKVNRDRWRGGPVCRTCKGDGRSPGAKNLYCPVCWGTGDAGGLTRQLDYLHNVEPSSVTGATGFALNEQVRVTYHRGMKNVECRAVDVWERSESPIGWNTWDWRPTPWALAVCTHHPDVIEWRLTDFEPNTGTFPDEASWYLHDGTGDDYPHWLPAFLSTSLRRAAPNAVWQKHWHDDRWAVVTFGTVEEAKTCLARAVVLWICSFLKGAP